MMWLEEVIRHVRASRTQIEALRPEVVGWPRDEKEIFRFLEESVMELEERLTPLLDERPPEHQLVQ